MVKTGGADYGMGNYQFGGTENDCNGCCNR